jgi:hypothetical protein
LEWNSTCFGQFLCPSSGVFHCTHSNGIWHTVLLTFRNVVRLNLSNITNYRVGQWNGKKVRGGWAHCSGVGRWEN